MKRFTFKLIFLSLLLAAAVGLVYAQTGDFSFVRLDDHDYTFRCPFVRDGFSPANLKAAVQSVRHAAIWMPVTYVSYMLDITCFGPGTGPHHWVNVALHAANAVLFFLFLFLLFRPRADEPPPSFFLPCCFFAAAFWALHPLRVESVAWIAGRKELLFTFFTLSGLIAWYYRRWPVGWVFCALACMSKPTAMIFPALAVCVELRTDGLAPLRRSFRPVFLRLLPLLLMALATGALAVYSQTHAEGYEVRDLFSAPVLWRLLNASVTLGLTFFQSVFPVGIHADYRAVIGACPRHTAVGLVTFAAVFAAGGAVVLKGNAVWRRRMGVAGLWFLAAFIPVLGLFGSFGEQARADRFTYVPCMALSFLIAGAGSFRVLQRFGRKAVLGIGIAVLMFYGGVSGVVAGSWKNDFTLFTRVLDFDPDSGRALAHLGSEYCARNHLDLGISYFRKSRKLRPRPDTDAQLAFALAMRGTPDDFAEVRSLCTAVIKDPSRDAKGLSLEALGMAAMGEHRWADALPWLEASLKAPRRFYPEADTHLRRATCLIELGRSDEARAVLLPLARTGRLGIRAGAAALLRRLPH